MEWVKTEKGKVRHPVERWFSDTERPTGFAPRYIKCMGWATVRLIEPHETGLRQCSVCAAMMNEPQVEQIDMEEWFQQYGGNNA